MPYASWARKRKPSTKAQAKHESASRAGKAQAWRAIRKTDQAKRKPGKRNASLKTVRNEGEADREVAESDEG
ncbi:hypothetical protein GCM10010172_84100 [Paractinoplanes ferrugineus]|uniref:Uncharacterized protein n=1 Tax=Paractinoplanes ferrugineus TaxID=113564 RepID=A0A919IZM9_9ACTN|nr:hypothetical protein [Actinoplanes ferrugineus]GIE10732.1 hypothetical protein Afe05nite_25720 [Actinoplanes ferrugineus]